MPEATNEIVLVGYWECSTEIREVIDASDSCSRASRESMIVGPRR